MRLIKSLAGVGSPLHPAGKGADEASPAITPPPLLLPPSPEDGNLLKYSSGVAGMRWFASNARKQLDVVSEEIETLESEFKSVVEYFGEDLNMTTSTFFGTFKAF